MNSSCIVPKYELVILRSFEEGELTLYYLSAKGKMAMESWLDSTSSKNLTRVLSMPHLTKYALSSEVISL